MERERLELTFKTGVETMACAIVSVALQSTNATVSGGLVPFHNTATSISEQYPSTIHSTASRLDNADQHV